jgi:hypothetical protein
VKKHLRKRRTRSWWHSDLVEALGDLAAAVIDVLTRPW